ncbi:MAG: ABC transporter ATP-binding protein [Undibacterium sp.]|nr:ABC transporter ATP-binding protein [Opitutaceae bacterium]
MSIFSSFARAPSESPAPTIATPPACAASVFTANRVMKIYGEHIALAGITLSIPAGHVVGLLGRNGAGKSTLLQIAAGLVLPTYGTCHTLGCRTDLLDSPELTRLGFVMQEGKFIEWMTVAQHLAFTASFYPRWDHDLQRRLATQLEVPIARKIAELSPGDRQKVGILLGVCHRPALLLLDEPMSALDPIVRRRLLDVLLERLRDDACTIVISSHLLNDVEKIVDWIIALDAGRVVENSSLDDLQESFAEWTVTATDAAPLATFTEPFIVAQQRTDRQARLTVRTSAPDAAEAFATTHGVGVQTRRLSLDEMFPLLLAAQPAISAP